MTYKLRPYQEEILAAIEAADQNGSFIVIDADMYKRPYGTTEQMRKQEQAIELAELRIERETACEIGSFEPPPYNYQRHNRVRRKR